MSFERFFPDQHERENIDRETIEGLASLMGVSISAIEQKIAEREELSRKAWKKKRRSSKIHQASEVASFTFLMEFETKRLFYSFDHDLWVIGVEGKTCGTSSMKEALHILAVY